MASVSSFNDSLWRASISDRKRYKNAKQIYYPKSDFSLRQAESSATALEYRHKDGSDDFDLWQVDINFKGNKVILRQLEGKSTLTFRDIFTEWIEKKKPEVAERTTETYEYVYGRLIAELGNFIPGQINHTTLSNFVNDGRLGYRKVKKSVVNQVLEHAHKKYNTPYTKIELQSSAAERKEMTSKAFKDFLIEYHALELADAASTRSTNGNSYPPELFSYFFLLLFYFPRRRNDFIHIKPEWLQGKIVTIGDSDYLPKSQMQELVTPTEEALELLNVVIGKYGRPGERIFPFVPNYATTMFRRTLKKVYPGLVKKVTLHKLRDSGILYLMYEKNMNTADIMSITGHESLSSLQKYIHRSAKALIHQRKEEFDVNSMLKLKNKFFQRTD